MKPFTFTSSSSVQNAASDLKQSGNSSYLAGGTCLIDLMKLYVMTPDHLVDLRKGVPAAIEDRGSTVYIGAGVSNSALAHHQLIVDEFPVLSAATLSGASPQLRNAATVGGNIMQRTRCLYFRDTASPCNKREPGSGCGAMDGFNRSNAILGGSEHCIATHPSDMCVALAMLDTVLYLSDGDKTRQVNFTDFHTVPGDHPEVETILKPGELITAIEIRKSKLSVNSHYVKIRDRASFAFALASAAVALQTSGGIITGARLALGGVGTKPWRAFGSEKMLPGKPATRDSYAAAAQHALQTATLRKYNNFKRELAIRTIVKAFEEITPGV